MSQTQNFGIELTIKISIELEPELNSEFNWTIELLSWCRTQTQKLKTVTDAVWCPIILFGFFLFLFYTFYLFITPSKSYKHLLYNFNNFFFLLSPIFL